MAGHQPARGGLRETMVEYARRRQREVERFGQEAEAAAREAYGRATREGVNLILRTQGEAIRYGANLIGGKAQPAARPSSAPRNAGASSAPRPTPTRSAAVRPAASASGGQRGNWLDRNPVAKAVGGEAARQAGNLAGVVRGGVHAVEGLSEGVVFLNRLANPLDQLISPPGQSAAEQLVGAGRGVVDYVQRGVVDPQRVVRDVRAKAHQVRVDLDPSATPVASTLVGELRRNFDIGQNQGELAFDVGSLAVGGPLAKSVKEVGLLSKAASYKRARAQGFTHAEAEYLSEPYPSSAMGHHYVSRRTKLPSILGGGPLPRAYSDGPFNRLAPEGITRGEMYERHFRVDPRFHGTGLPKRLNSQNWSGHKLGLERYSLPGQLWHGAPAPLKARVGGLTAGAGGLLYSDPSEEE